MIRVAAALAMFVVLGSATAAAQVPPSREELVEQVRRAELAFAATVAEKRAEAFAAMVDEAAIFLGARNEVARGRAEVVAAWAGFFEPDAPSFAWRPEVVELSADGTLGLSRGPWTLRGRDPQGNPVERSGTFTSVWRLQADGAWQVIFDAGCGPCPDCG